MLAQHLFALLPLLAGLGEATPLPLQRAYRREVPQELSHDKFLRTTQEFLQLDNPDNIVDPVFGLLGNAAAAEGAGAITNLDCLQQEIADRAFTNAKAQNDVEGMTAALVYRALERNTLGVGVKSVLCNEAAINQEIDAISQHQDPASEGAAATNKAITLALAQQIASIGGDPLVAIESGTFTPGDLNDNTGKGNTCDDPDCIFEDNRLVPDASKAEINEAVQGIAAGQNNAVAPPTEQADQAEECPVENEDGAANDQANDGDDDNSGEGGGNAAGIDLGPCTDFSMTFEAGREGRGADEFTFLPSDLVNFNRGDALNPDIIAVFMCDQFVNQCGKSAATRDVCKGVQGNLLQQLDAGTLQRNQDYADAWLADLEVAFLTSSTGTGTAVIGGNENAVFVPEDENAAQNNDTNILIPETEDNRGLPGPGNGAAGPGKGAAGPGPANGNNVQTFTGTLNGAAAPPVVQGAGPRPFSLNGETFVNKAAALQRSCAVQHNACANAANSGTGNSNVAACDAQESDCLELAVSA